MLDTSSFKKREMFIFRPPKSYKDSNMKETAWRKVATEIGLSDDNGSYGYVGSITLSICFVCLYYMGSDY